ncbi:MAG: crotonase/enoyl-CoA hydratase family protein [Syntrophomonadaceae bacterium]|nr:crotonase/enoyl-CoA hydratase family protein [Syntrophomonadaceae bacterium]
MEHRVTVDKDGHVLLIGLDYAAKRNAMDLDMYWQLAEALGQLDKDPDLRCGLLYAKGDHFTTGLDLVKWAPVFAEGKFPDMPEGYFDPFRLDEDKRVSKPMVMAAQGYCLTWGFEVMLTTDIRIGTTDLKLAQIEVQRGIYPVGGATVRLQQEVGWGTAMRYLLTGDIMSGPEAYRLGVIQELVEPGQQFERGLEMAHRVATKSAPLGVRAIIKSAHRARIYGNQAALNMLMPEILPIMTSEDSAEGVQAFIERREAVFKGK